MGKYKLLKRWDDAKADYLYSLRGPMNNDVGDTYETTLIDGGDLAWAKRIAKHYGITLPTKSTEEPK